MVATIEELESLESGGEIPVSPQPPPPDRAAVERQRRDAYLAQIAAARVAWDAATRDAVLAEQHAEKAHNEHRLAVEQRISEIRRRMMKRRVEKLDAARKARYDATQGMEAAIMGDPLSWQTVAAALKRAGLTQTDRNARGWSTSGDFSVKKGWGAESRGGDRIYEIEVDAHANTYQEDKARAQRQAIRTKAREALEAEGFLVFEVGSTLHVRRPHVPSGPPPTTRPEA